MPNTDAENPPVSLTIDRQACAGHGLCYGEAPELVDSDDQGYPLVLVDPVPANARTHLRAVVDMCPERALSIVASPKTEG
ncbi:ferredoxin [Aldersonia kunmingensis]|uniref:ferredoxin n=1 Tax=Aldersonia kunmingensis TaxID=408066 RepID=UPI0008297101|nr:ferredoxin [Aldersonia kunmingensis]